MHNSTTEQIRKSRPVVWDELCLTEHPEALRVGDIVDFFECTICPKDRPQDWHPEQLHNFLEITELCPAESPVKFNYKVLSVSPTFYKYQELKKQRMQKSHA